MIVTKLHRGIDVAGAGDPLFDHPHCFQSKSHPKAARRKTGYVSYRNGLFIHSLGDLTHNCGRFVTRLFTHDDFN